MGHPCFPILCGLVIPQSAKATTVDSSCASVSEQKAFSVPALLHSPHWNVMKKKVQEILHLSSRYCKEEIKILKNHGDYSNL